MVKYTLTYTHTVYFGNSLDRLLSGYNDKLVEDNTIYRSVLGRWIIRHFRDNPTNKSLTYGHDVTFAEFFKMLKHRQKTWKFVDAHWENYYKVCFPCAIQYDYIAKLETSDTDAQFIIKNKLSGKTEVMKQKWNQFRNQMTFMKYGRMLEEYNQVPDGLFQEVFEYYRDDMDMFGYTAVKDVLSGKVYAKCSTGSSGCC